MINVTLGNNLNISLSREENQLVAEISKGRNSTELREEASVNGFNLLYTKMQEVTAGQAPLVQEEEFYSKMHSEKATLLA